mmetsp:Transcript_11675/g.17139  ORF Transcript_11675/g.17139 Transcript_11675/m.17139 type:complete len:333 (+) Transcript_11675:168-1166(+)
MASAHNTTESANAQDVTKTREHNPRWQGYFYVAFWSLVNFAAIGQINDDMIDWRLYPFSLSSGIVTFTLFIIVLAIDRVFYIKAESFNVHTAFDGKLEGFLLVFSVLWWIVGVIVQTHADGVAYQATNIYISSWLSLIACVYTLDLWSGSLDIVTIKELTSLSLTLPGWYTLFFGSLVVLGSAADVYSLLTSEELKTSAAFGISLGSISSIVSGYFILLHYRCIQIPKTGGWIELIVIGIMFIFWIAGLAVLTSANTGIAPSMGKQCSISGEIPSTNIYLFSWLCFFSCGNIALKWNSSYAMAFAQAVQGRGEEEDDIDGRKEDSEEDEDMI